MLSPNLVPISNKWHHQIILFQIHIMLINLLFIDGASIIYLIKAQRSDCHQVAFQFHV